MRIGNTECELCGQIHPSGHDCQAARAKEDQRFAAAIASIGRKGLEKDGWCYRVRDVPEGDARKLVTLEQDGMTWIGIRAFHHQDRRWMNNNEPERATVIAWRDLPNIARGFYDRGQLVVPPSATGASTP